MDDSNDQKTIEYVFACVDAQHLDMEDEWWQVIDKYENAHHFEQADPHADLMDEDMNKEVVQYSELIDDTCKKYMDKM